MRTKKRDGIYKLYSFDMCTYGIGEIEYVIQSRLYEDIEGKHENGIIEYYSSLVKFYGNLLNVHHENAYKTEFFLIDKDDSNAVIQIMRYLLGEIVDILNDDSLDKWDKNWSTNKLYNNIFGREIPKIPEITGKRFIQEALLNIHTFKRAKKLAIKVINGVNRKIIMPLDFDLPKIMPQKLADVILANNWLDMSVFFQFMKFAEKETRIEVIKEYLIKTLSNIKKGLNADGRPLWKVVGVKQEKIIEETAKHYLAFMCGNFNQFKKCF